VHEFVRDLEAKGRGLEAYRAAPEQEAAFASLAAALTAHKKAKELGQLLEEHAKRPAGGVALLRYRGELHLLRGEPAEAEKQFAAALERATPAERYSAQAGLNRARARAGTVLAAYKKLGPGSFEELANACLAEKSAGQLEALLAAHRKARPKELGLSVRELELRWLKGDHAAALRLLEEDPEGLFGLPRFSWRREDYRVRALVRLKRADEAVREVEARYRPRRGQALLVVLAHAARGGAGEALTAAAKLPGGELHVPLLYGDPDLGPLLRGEAFRAFRAKYPPPKEDNEADR
jgi:hypothetical protein